MEVPLEHLDSLGGSLSRTPIALPTRRAIINQMFNLELSQEEINSSYGLQAYFSDWFEEQCETAASQVSVKSHRDILDVIACLQATNTSHDRTSIASILSQSTSMQHVDMDSINASITLAARLWLGISIDSFQRSQTPGRVIAWSEGTLVESIRKAMFNKSVCTDAIKYPRNFTAANLEKVGGIRVSWTSNIADHLLMKDDDTTVILFHQISFLELHRHPKSKGPDNTILTSALIDETRRTLGLLIPSTDKRLKRWFRRQQREHCLDPQAGLCGPLNAAARQIDSFDTWKDRLIILKQIYDDAEPRTASLLLYDDRKKVQWFTFWIAALVLLLTVVFGLIQSVSGIIQAWAAVKGLHR